MSDDEPVTFRAMFETDDEQDAAPRPCPQCGQTVDQRALIEVLYHRRPDHQPMAL